MVLDSIIASRQAYQSMAPMEGSKGIQKNKIWNGITVAGFCLYTDVIVNDN